VSPSPFVLFCLNARIDSGDKPARNELRPLNKSILAEGRLIVSLTRQRDEARKWHTMAKDQAAHAARLARVAADAGLPRDRLFEVETPDHRTIRHRHSSPEALAAQLLPGYTVAGEVFGADEQGRGGFSVAANHGLIEFLTAHGVKVLPGEAA
jgi:hypothetical protein